MAVLRVLNVVAYYIALWLVNQVVLAVLKHALVS